MRIRSRSLTTLMLRAAATIAAAGLASVVFVVPAHAQVPQLPGMGGATPADCARMEEAFRGGGASLGGMDMRAMIAAMGCRPAAAPAPEKTAAASECESYRQVLANLEDGDWLGPMPVAAARMLSGSCRNPAASAAEQRALAGWSSFGDGRFTQAADAFRDAQAQASTDAARIRYAIERSQSLVAAGRSAEALPIIEQILVQLPDIPAARETRRSVFGGMPTVAELNADAKREDQRRARVAQRIEVLTLLGIAHLDANDVPAAIRRLREAESITQARAKAQGGAEMTQPFDDRYGAPALAIALQRAGRTHEAQPILERIVRGREQAMEGMEQVKPAMTLVQQTMSSLGLAGMFESANMSKALAAAEDAKVALGELLGLVLACSMLEEIHVTANRAEAALEVAERCRGRALARTLANRAFQPKATVTMPSNQEIEAYARQHRVDFSTAGTALTRERLSNREAQAASHPATIADMRRAAAERNATLIVYSIVYAPNRLPARMPDRETGITIWVVAPDGAVTVRRRGFESILPEGTLSLTSAALRAHAALGVPGRGAEVTPALERGQPRSNRAMLELKRFYRILIEPVEDLLPAQEGARLLFIPQGPLFLVPFAALENSHGEPLVSRYAISMAPSVQTLALTAARKQASRATGAALIVGNPLMPRYSPVPGKPPLDIAPLPGAEEEAKAIAVLLKTTFLTGPGATKAAVLRGARDARFVHLATHGFLDDFADQGQQGVNPHFREVAMETRADGGMKTPGMLAFAPSGADSGMLTADEIAAATTGAELVVMSACGSGQGVINDDGVIGLSRAWMAAGAPSVLVTLWAIPDEPTRELMVEFYRRLTAGSAKAEALRGAMLATRAKHPNPVNWAAFVLLGEPE